MCHVPSNDNSFNVIIGTDYRVHTWYFVLRTWYTIIKAPYIQMHSHSSQHRRRQIPNNLHDEIRVPVIHL